MITPHLKNECKTEAKPAQQKGQEEKTRRRAERRREISATIEMTGRQFRGKIRRRERCAAWARWILNWFVATNPLADEEPPLQEELLIGGKTQWLRSFVANDAPQDDSGVDGASCAEWIERDVASKGWRRKAAAQEHPRLSQVAAR